jgi:hypothetical protein
MHQDTGLNRVLKIEDYVVSNTETLKNRSIAPIEGSLPTGFVFPFIITFPASPSGAITATNGALVDITGSLLGYTTLSVPVAGDYIKIGISYSGNGNLIFTAGTPAATISAATPPPAIGGSYAIGYVVLQNIAGTMSNVTSDDIYQYTRGAELSSPSTAILETLKNDFVNSPYNLMSSDVFSVDGNVLVDPTSTASYNVTSKALDFASAGQTLISVNMLDAQEFLTAGRDIWDMRAIIHWRLANLDTAAVYEVSRDGGAHYATVDMSRIGANTEVYYGDYRWLREEENSVTVQNVFSPSADTTLTDVAGVIESAAQKFTFTARTRGTTLRMFLKKTSSPAGSYRMAIYSDSASAPSARLFTTGWVLASTLGTSYANSDISINYQNFEANVTYWLVLETDADYKAGVGSGTISWGRQAGASLQHLVLDGVVWSQASALAEAAYAVIGGQESFAAIDGFAGSTTSSLALNITTSAFFSQKFTTVASQVLKKVTIKLEKVQTAGTLIGLIYLQIIKDDTLGAPSTNYEDIVAGSAGLDVTTLAVSAGQFVDFILPTTAIPPGDYHIVLSSDATYKSSYSVAVRSIIWEGFGGGTPVGNRRSIALTPWTAAPGATKFIYNVLGRPLDLRLRVTSSAGSKSIEAFTTLYDKEIVGISGGIKNIQSFRFQAVADNLSQFQLTAFAPDVDLLNVYHVERGKVYRFGVFSMQGSKLVFPANFFYNAGVEETVTLICTQLEGSSFDNSDSNALLLANNFLGSTDATIDRSQPGRGIVLRRPDGGLREISISNTDTIVVTVV